MIFPERMQIVGEQNIESGFYGQMLIPVIHQHYIGGRELFHDFPDSFATTLTNENIDTLTEPPDVFEGFIADFSYCVLFCAVNKAFCLSFVSTQNHRRMVSVSQKKVRKVSGVGRFSRSSCVQIANTDHRHVKFVPSSDAHGIQQFPHGNDE
ncbi:hypothetical protein SDC9_72373 [bioreactor metagenome]|uniref:Uncharacterized protein n=1 Tax=bioreactor metagenome TaxID=1076179 RepID=A0A644YHB2_9ZZZZ